MGNKEMRTKGELENLLESEEFQTLAEENTSEELREVDVENRNEIEGENTNSR